jgi:hypothetical protein
MTRSRGITVLTPLLCFAAGALFIAPSLRAESTSSSPSRAAGGESAALSAFRDVASVLTSPRCLNCHLNGDSPLQGDQHEPHNMNVKRGADGRGTPAMRCTNCHQSTNVDSAHAPPGAPDWRLPAADTPMAWLGLSTGALCRTLKDPAKNGRRSASALLEHVTEDRTVNWAWNPGIGRSAPPLSHQRFVDTFKEWVDGGAPCEP